MTYWWVNQNQTYEHEVRGGYLWSPKTNANGGRNNFYDNMKKVAPGDVIFSFCDTKILAIGIASDRAQTAAKPSEFGNTGANWGAEGWFVKTDFTELNQPIRPVEIIDQLRPTLPPIYSPLQNNGKGNQGVYLAEVPEAMAGILIKELSGQVESVVSKFTVPDDTETLDDEAEETVSQSADLTETEKVQIIMARRGQGVFRSRVQLVEDQCRITGVTIKKHLIASHIKPWHRSSNSERLDGNNGLLLAPHIDHLFDKGFISFSDDGMLLSSPRLSNNLVSAWGIKQSFVKPFTPEQVRYLKYHRERFGFGA